MTTTRYNQNNILKKYKTHKKYKQLILTDTGVTLYTCTLNNKMTTAAVYT